MRVDAPIPGESLTTPPKNYPFERPPEVTDPKKALRVHMKRLQDPEMMFNIASALEMGVTVKELTSGIIRGAVTQGVHTIDVGLLVAPAIHKAVVTIGTKAKVEFEEGLRDLNETVKSVDNLTLHMAKKQKLSEQEEEPEVVVEDQIEGFMKRRSSR